MSSDRPESSQPVFEFSSLQPFTKSYHGGAVLFRPASALMAGDVVPKSPNHEFSQFPLFQ